MSERPISRRQLAASLIAASHIADRGMIATFVADAATQAAPNPFAQTSAGAVRQIWQQRAAEFRSFDVEAAGLSCLIKTVTGMGVNEVLMQEILRAGPHTANVFHRGDGCEIVGAVLYGKPGAGLPSAPALRRQRPALKSQLRGHKVAGQLDLFRPA